MVKQFTLDLERDKNGIMIRTFLLQKLEKTVVCTGFYVLAHKNLKHKNYFSCGKHDRKCQNDMF